MAISTQPVCQSLFDFLDGKNNFEKLEAIRNGELGREINRYVQCKLEAFHIGTLPESLPDSLWGSHHMGSAAASTPANPLVFGAPINGQNPMDLVGEVINRVTGPEDLQPGLGGLDETLSRNSSTPTEHIFRSHRS
ncbi:MAG: hypothetical protein FJ077_01805 [Cyanobacteria bacterium K_DeepCast_35m_m2_023]|nr:hypothetical protein [Cyanobacteria bacterium K_DeepCast_35m_m2_023]